MTNDDFSEHVKGLDTNSEKYDQAEREWVQRLKRTGVTHVSSKPFGDPEFLKKHREDNKWRVEAKSAHNTYANRKG
ncbi:hypothetical protein [Psychromonas hadalis]|uniref:hypothetical protein n=1 Tax=Psychromonas hadalis TaxID=211669 RepID=UPI0003B6E594|nr:hypothetical protein [Psychromonas hadalis]